MDIRYLEPEDFKWIKETYDKYFSDMDFPDFYNQFLVSFVAHEYGKIIAIGGIKSIAEAVIISDKSFSVRNRRDALFQMYHAMTYSAEKLKFNQIHAFSFDPEYSHHLMNKVGFKCNPDNRVLTLNIGKSDG